MSLPSFSADESASLVGDASVWINLVATERAEQIVGASPTRMLITTTALGELETGRAKGRQAAAGVAQLIAAGLVTEVALRAGDEAVFLDLIAGPTSVTLDDGEAATIAYALGARSIALIDERKATDLCSRRHPQLAVVSTTDLLFSDPVASALGSSALSDSLFLALTGARMRVPAPHLPRVCELLGLERRRLCRSLPACWR